MLFFYAFNWLVIRFPVLYWKPFSPGFLFLEGGECDVSDFCLFPHSLLAVCLCRRAPKSHLWNWCGLLNLAGTIQGSCLGQNLSV